MPWPSHWVFSRDCSKTGLYPSSPRHLMPLVLARRPSFKPSWPCTPPSWFKPLCHSTSEISATAALASSTVPATRSMSGRCDVHEMPESVHLSDPPLSTSMYLCSILQQYHSPILFIVGWRQGPSFTSFLFPCPFIGLFFFWLCVFLPIILLSAFIFHLSSAICVNLSVNLRASSRLVVV